MNQQQIEALLQDSVFEDSQVQNSRSDQAVSTKQIKKEEQNQYESQQFQSYDESRRTIGKNNSKCQFQESKILPLEKKNLPQIKEEPSEIASKLQKQRKTSVEKPKAKTGIYFYPPKQSHQSPSAQKKILPYSFTRMQQREKELLLTSLTEQNKQLKESLRNKDNQYKKIQNMYKVFLQQATKANPSVREGTLEKQLSILQGKYDKLVQLSKLQKQKIGYKTSKYPQTFIPQSQVSQREDQLLNIIQKLKERLISTNNELKTLQQKMNEGENYVDQLRRKLKRIQQLQLRMDKMNEQAENDRQFIQILKDKNRKLQDALHDAERDKKSMEISIRRLELSQATQSDSNKQLQEVRKEKDLLQQNLRKISSNLMTKVLNTFPENNRIEDSEQFLRP